MQFRAFVPAAPLQPYVERVWICRGGQSARQERILPSGTFELVVNLTDDAVRIGTPVEQRFSGAVVSGTYARPFTIDASQHRAMLGVHFRPGGAFPFLGISAGELGGGHVDLADLWRSDLRGRLCDARRDDQRFVIVQETLLARLAGAPKRHPAVANALSLFHRTRGAAAVGEVAKVTGLSQRRLITLFREEVGLTPKVFARIVRFQHARSLIRRDLRNDWADLALQAKFCDQAYMIREFRELAGMTPGEYIRGIADDCLRNHVVAW